ncbi:MAG: serine hydrolase domain-containing protein [Pseudomonas oryzihabitans]|uniref:serine hydrolase domain-containing protein n=1 Tax=Pseudomonas TaxID=286 RepID=UPI0005A8915A|nr:MULTISPECIES: serine hydrolase domain-containing protein [Pseudomonas]MDU4059136.1 serine hydrolase domain-containing protein [Pseudomonas oryzihabitans]NMZ46220.1 beta-lactamase family protein [Pseudomonas oryzihabitans]RAU39611.1 serine hydrolase [Pseudomonas sp. RIT 411]
MSSLLLASALGLGLSTPLAQAEDAALAARLDPILEQAIAQQRIVGTVVMVAHQGRVVYRRAAGFADREARRPMQEDQLFRFASLTKPLVAVTALRLADQGRLDLQAPVSRYLPYFTPALADGTPATPTLAQLLSHTAGLHYGFGEDQHGPYHRAGVSDGLDDASLTLEENLRRLAGVPLDFQPGTQWRYSLGLDVMGGVLAAATGQPLPAVVQREVAAPLGLHDLSFHVSDAGRLATAYRDGYPRPEPMSEPYLLPMPKGGILYSPARALSAQAFASGGGGMQGSAGDYLAFLEALRQGRLLQPASQRLFMEDQIPELQRDDAPGWGFSLGAAVLRDARMAKTPQTPGTLQWGGVYGNAWFIDPARELSVVILTNTAIAGMSGPFPDAIRDALYRD